MKKASLLIIAALLAAVSGCQNDTVQEPIQDVEPHKIFAVIEEETATKTSLSPHNAVLWSEGDQIAVFKNSMSGSIYQVSPESVGSSSGSFVCVENKSKGVTIGADVAFYPYKSGMYCTNVAEGSYTVSGFEFPAVQTYVADSFGEGIFPMVAVSEAGSDDFSFRNVAGVLKLLLTGSDAVKTLTLKGNDDEPLSGKATIAVSMDGSDPKVEMGSGAGISVKLDCGSGVQLDPETPTAFLIVLPPVTFKSGFTVVVESMAGAKANLTTSKEAVVSRSAILRMPQIEFKPVGGVVINEVSSSFNEIVISVSISDVVQYSGGYVLAEDFSLATVTKNANWKIAPRFSDSFEYYGPLTGFPAQDPVPVSAGQSYVVWVAPYKDGQTSVKQQDIVYKEFTVPSASSGGKIEVVASNIDAGVKYLQVDMTAEGAVMIYPALLTENEFRTLPDEASKISYLLSKVAPVEGEYASVRREGLSPNMNVKFIAMAIDEDGKYGPLTSEDLTTAVPMFDDDFVISLTVSYEGKTAFVRLSDPDPDVTYYYYTGKTSSSAWTKYFGGTRESAEEYMAVNLDSYLLKNTADTPLVDGCIVYDKIEMETEHVVVVMAQDKNGTLSRAFMLTFIPELYLGDIVLSKGDTRDKWLASKPEVVFGKCAEDGEFYMINWSVIPAEGMKAYAVCTHPNSMEDCDTVEKLITRIFNMGAEAVSGKMETLIYGDKGNFVYVTWCDADGNYYEPVSQQVPQS